MIEGHLQGDINDHKVEVEKKDRGPKQDGEWGECVKPLRGRMILEEE